MHNPFKLKLKELNLPYKTILGTASAKTVKGEKIGYLTAIVYLKPSIKICPLSKLAGCLKPCLATAGRGAFNSVQQARESKTRFYFENREAFLLSIASDIWSLCNTAKNKHLTPLVRLNGTSDIDYENLIVCDGKNIFQLFPEVQFYDYTKHPSRNIEGKTAGNYDLTYSYSGITPHNVTIKGLLNPSNSRVAVVFQNQEDIPSTFRGWTTIDGDNTDVRHIEPKTVVVALYAKGKAKHDYSGFTQIKGRDYV
jgi:hypothetical protein